MQKWWVAVAALVGISLAVLLIPRPDTGGEVPEAAGPEITASPTAVTSDDIDGLITSADRKAATKPLTVEERLAEPKGNPIAERTAAKRDVPEAHFAAKALAPWTETRRRIALKDSTSEDAMELIEDINTMTADMRTLRREPYNMDWDETEASQRELIAKIRSHRLHDSHVEETLVLIEERIGEYYEERKAGEAEVIEVAP